MSGHLRRLAATWFLGLLLGGVLATLYSGSQIDRISQHNQKLAQQLELRQEELELLKKSLGERRREVVTSIEPHVEIMDRDMSALEKQGVSLSLEKQVREWLEPVKGQELSKLNHLLIPQIVDERTAPAGEAEYRLAVKLVVIGENLVIYLEAHRESTLRPVSQPAS